MKLGSCLSRRPARQGIELSKDLTQQQIFCCCVPTSNTSRRTRNVGASYAIDIATVPARHRA